MGDRGSEGVSFLNWGGKTDQWPGCSGSDGGAYICLWNWKGVRGVDVEVSEQGEERSGGWELQRGGDEW